MKRIAILLAGTAIAVSAAGCGMGGRIVNGKWVDGPLPKTFVYCVGADDGGITCDWQGYWAKNGEGK